MSLHLCTVQKGIKGRIGVVDPQSDLLDCRQTGPLHCPDSDVSMSQEKCPYVSLWHIGIRAPILFIYNLHSDW